MHKVRARVFNVDENRYEELEFEVSDDLYKIITNGIGTHYSISKEDLPKSDVAPIDEVNKYLGNY